MRLRRKRAPEADEQRLASREPSAWLTFAERAVIGGLVGRAVAGDQQAGRELGRLAPAARFPAVLALPGADVAGVVLRTERLVVDYRRRLAARDVADGTGESWPVLAARFWPLGYAPPRGESLWSASGAIA